MSPVLCARDALALSPGEVNFLWWFMQGSIMDAATRRKLWGAWGLCERHGAAWIAVEAAFRHGRLHGPAIVYSELLGAAVRALSAAGPRAVARAARRLRARNACLVCEAGIGPDSPGFAPGRRAEIGNDLSPLRAFMAATESHWRRAVCGRCARSPAPARCRIHLIQELAARALPGLPSHRNLVGHIAAKLARYETSFQWDRRATATAAERAALVSAVGWCGGWTTLLGVFG